MGRRHRQRRCRSHPLPDHLHGFRVQAHYPHIQGLETFRGETAHASRWPQNDIEFAGKRVGIVGTGASGVQLTEQSSRRARHTTLFQRTPALALPLRQRKISPEEQAEMKAGYQAMYDSRAKTFAGFGYEFTDSSWHDHSPEARRKHYEEAWDRARSGLGSAASRS